MGLIDESYGRNPVPAEKWPEAMLERSIEEAREALDGAQSKLLLAAAALRKAEADEVLWRSRLAHLDRALAAMRRAVPAPVPPPRRTPPSLLTPCPTCQQSHWTDEPCRIPPPVPVPTGIKCESCGTFFLSNQEHQCVRLSDPSAPRGSSHLLSDEPLPSDKGPHDDPEILY